jgi:hypothetical protein
MSICVYKWNIPVHPTVAVTFTKLAQAALIPTNGLRVFVSPYSFLPKSLTETSIINPPSMRVKPNTCVC